MLIGPSLRSGWHCLAVSRSDLGSGLCGSEVSPAVVGMKAILAVGWAFDGRYGGCVFAEMSSIVWQLVIGWWTLVYRLATGMRTSAQPHLSSHLLPTSANDVRGWHTVCMVLGG